MSPLFKAFTYGIITTAGLLTGIVYFGKAKAEAPPGVATKVCEDTGELCYSVPLTKRDGSISSIDVDDAIPHQFLLCREKEEGGIQCIVRGTSGGVGTVDL